MVSARDFLARALGGQALGLAIILGILGGASAAEPKGKTDTLKGTATPATPAAPSPGATPTPPQQPSTPPRSILPARMDLDPLEKLPVFVEGRPGPFYFFARQKLAAISGSESYRDSIYDELSATTVIASLWLNPESWTDQPLIQVNDADLRRALGLPEAASRETYETLTRRTRLPELVADARATRAGSGPAALSRRQRLVLGLARRLEAFREIRDGSALRVVPPRAGGEWRPAEDAPALYPGPLGQSVPESLQRMKQAFRGADPAAFAAALEAFGGTLARLNPTAYPEPDRFRFEIWIAQADLGWWAGWTLACGAVVNMLTFQRRRGAGYVAACILAIAGATLLLAEMVGHSLLTRSAFVSSLPGSGYLVPFALILAGLAVELCWRRRYILLLTAGAASVWLFASAWLSR